MAERGEVRRILEMLVAGQLKVDEAAELLEALREDGGPPAPPTPRGIARQLSIRVEADREDGGQQTRVALNVPLSLAKFAARLLPSEAKAHLEAHGVNLGELLEPLHGDLPEGRLIDIDAAGDDGGQRAKIVIEVI